MDEREDARGEADGRSPAAVHTAGPRDTVKVVTSVLGPVIAAGMVKRRPRVMRLLARGRSDAGAVRVMQDLRARYGTGPLRLSAAGRSLALIMSNADVGRVLAGSPDPFLPASAVKRSALNQFQPHGVLISDGDRRAHRREFTEKILETAQPVHYLAPVLQAIIREESANLPSTLDWDNFAGAWWRMVRRIVLGERARDDYTSTDLLARLRLAANWAFLAPDRRNLRERFLRRLGTHLRRAEPETLAGMIAETGLPESEAASQVAHWLFAFDAGGMVTYRALALLDTHPEARARAVEDTSASGPEQPYLRASVLDTVRLWPTTPVILRDSAKDTAWDGDSLPAGTGLIIFAPFFHRDDENLPYAHTFTPEIWLDGRAQANPALVPFSAGPGECPGRNLVLLMSSTLVAELLLRYRLSSGTQLSPSRPLPSTVDNFTLAFES